MGMDHVWLDGPAMRLASFMRGQQFDANSSYFTKNPDKAMGGLRESLVINDIRIDYVQHAMCAWLHFARVLRDERDLAAIRHDIHRGAAFERAPAFRRGSHHAGLVAGVVAGPGSRQ
jgi:hypothetical protein